MENSKRIQIIRSSGEPSEYSSDKLISFLKDLSQDLSPLLDLKMVEERVHRGIS
jgi:hypothetical protein